MRLCWGLANTEVDAQSAIGWITGPPMEELEKVTEELEKVTKELKGSATL